MFAEEELSDLQDYLPKIQPRRTIKESAPDLIELLGDEIDIVRWYEHGKCLGVDTNIFYPERGQPTKTAKEYCRGCPVRLHCALDAMENNEKTGIWGGLSERERRRVRRQRKEQREKHGSVEEFFEYLKAVSSGEMPVL